MNNSGTVERPGPDLWTAGARTVHTQLVLRVQAVGAPAFHEAGLWSRID